MKKSDKKVRQQMAQRKAEQTEHEQVSIHKSTLKKPVGPSGTVIIMVTGLFQEHVFGAPCGICFQHCCATWSIWDPIYALTGI